jgi:hypothetical protein
MRKLSAITLLACLSLSLCASEKFFWSESLNECQRWLPAMVSHPKVYTIAGERSTNEFACTVVLNQGITFYSIEKTPGQQGALTAIPSFPLQPVESLAGAQEVSFEIQLDEPAPAALAVTELRFYGAGLPDIAVPFKLTKQGEYEKVVIALPADKDLTKYDRFGIKLSGDCQKIAWRWRNWSVTGKSAVVTPRAEKIDTVLALRPDAPVAMFYLSEPLSFNCVIPEEAQYVITDADGKEVQRGSVNPGRNVLPKLPCGYYFMTLTSAHWEYFHPRNFCVVADRVTLPEGKSAPYSVDTQIDVGNPYSHNRPDSAFPGWRYHTMVNTAARAGFQKVRLGTNFQRHEHYSQKALEASKWLKSLGVTTTHTIIPCGGNMDDPVAVYEHAQIIARDFKGLTDCIEFWNEPQAFGRPMVWNYAAAAKANYLGIRSVDPDVKIISCSYLSPTYMKAGMKNGMTEFYDAMCIHVYCPMDSYVDAVSGYRKVMSQYGMENCNFYITECSSYDGGEAKEIGYNGEKFKLQSLEQQFARADWYTKSQLFMQELGIAATCSFALPQVHEWGGFKDWGMVNDDWSARPALAAFSVLNTLLAPLEYLGMLAPAEGVKAHLFRHDDGTLTMAYWREAKDGAETLVIAQPDGEYCARNLYGTPTQLTARDGKLVLPLSTNTAYISGLTGIEPTKLALFTYDISHTDEYDRTMIVNLKAGEGLKDAKELMFVSNATGPRAKITVEVTNLGDKPRTGVVNFGGCVKAVTGPQITVQPMKTEKFEVALEWSFVTGGIIEDLVASGEFDGKPSSPAVMQVCYPEAGDLVARPFVGTEKTKNWRPAGAGGVSARDLEDGVIEFSMKVPSPMNTWLYPRYNFPKGTLEGVIGIEFDIWVDEYSISKGYQDPLIYFSNRAIHYEAPTKPGWKHCVVYTIGAIPEPEKATDIAIGFNTCNVDRLVTYRLRNIKLLYVK